MQLGQPIYPVLSGSCCVLLVPEAILNRDIDIDGYRCHGKLEMIIVSRQNFIVKTCSLLMTFQLKYAPRWHIFTSRTMTLSSA